MSVTPAEAAATMLARVARERAVLDQQWADLRKKLPDAARLLRERYHVRRVWVIGSLAWGGWHANSDVDVVVEGLDEGQDGRAWSELCDVFGRTVDLLEIERLPDPFRARVLREGEELP